MISFDEFQDKYIGKIGTPQRDALEKQVEEAVQSYKLGFHYIFCEHYH